MTKIIILAAGKGKRMNHELPKVLVPLKGRPMIEYLIESVIKSGVDQEPIIIVSPDNKNLIKEALNKYNCNYAIQDKQLGTGHALSCAKNFVSDDIDNIVVFYGDHPFVKYETIKKLAEAHEGRITMMTAKLEDFNGWRKNFYSWGRIIREGDKIKEIVEFKDANDKEKEIKEVNPGFYSFNRRWLWDNIERLENNNAQKEYYLTDLVKIASEQDIQINSILINSKEAVGINSKEELEIAEKLI